MSISGSGNAKRRPPGEPVYPQEIASAQASTSNAQLPLPKDKSTAKKKTGNIALKSRSTINFSDDFVVILYFFSVDDQKQISAKRRLDFDSSKTGKIKEIQIS